MLKSNRPILLLGLLVVVLIVAGSSYIFFYPEQEPPKIYRIEFDETWYPLELEDKAADLSVFSRELVSVIATREHLNIELVSVGSVDFLIEIENGEYDGALSSIILEETELKKYAETKPYYLLGPVLVVAASSPIKSLKELQGKTLGLIAGLGEARLLRRYPAINVIFYDYNAIPQLLDDVMNKKIDGTLMKMNRAYELVDSEFYHDKLKVVSDPLDDEGLRLIVKNDSRNQRVIRQFNIGLAEIKKDGTYSKLLRKWNLFNPEISKRH